MSRAENPPHWLRRLVLAALALVSIGIVIGPLALLAGAWIAGARETPLRSLQPPPPVDLAPGQEIAFGAEMTFGNALTVEAQFDLGADPLAWWGVTCSAEDGSAVHYRLTADGYFSVPPFHPDSRAFLHIRPPGQPNRLMILRGGTHLRINEEIAWDGALPTLDTCQLATGSVSAPARLVVASITTR